MALTNEKLKKDVIDQLYWDSSVDVVNHLAVVPTADVVDKEIATQIEKAMDRDAHMFAEHVTVEVEDGNVSLTGTVPSWNARWRAFDIAAVTPGVTHVDHELEIA